MKSENSSRWTIEDELFNREDQACIVVLVSHFISLQLQWIFKTGELLKQKIEAYLIKAPH